MKKSHEEGDWEIKEAFMHVLSIISNEILGQKDLKNDMEKFL